MNDVASLRPRHARLRPRPRRGRRCAEEETSLSLCYNADLLFFLFPTADVSIMIFVMTPMARQYKFSFQLYERTQARRTRCYHSQCTVLWPRRPNLIFNCMHCYLGLHTYIRPTTLMARLLFKMTWFSFYHVTPSLDFSSFYINVCQTVFNFYHMSFWTFS